MNGLSWLLYFADISQNIKALMWFGILTLTVLAIITGLCHDPCMAKQSTRDRFVALLETTTKIVAPLILLGGITPSKSTIYLIAASEMGEEALQTEAVQKVGDYLDVLLGELASDAP